MNITSLRLYSSNLLNKTVYIYLDSRLEFSTERFILTLINNIITANQMSKHDIEPFPPFSNPCVIHNPITFRGGGEQYAVELSSTLEAPLYTYEKNEDISFGSDVDIHEFGEDNFLDQQLMRSPLRGIARIISYENFSVPEKHDAVITTGSSAKAVIHHPHQKRYHLLHTPVRRLFDRGPGHFRDRLWPIKWFKQFYQSLSRVHDQSTISRIDEFIVNSEIIARRLQTYYNREAEHIIYPPVDLESYYHKEGRGFLLYLGRLDSHKRVDELIRAVSNTTYELHIVGTGPLEGDLRSISPENVVHHGFVSENEKRRYLAECDALLFNSEDEDFGIVPIEALASGKPVIGINEGFTRYQIEEGINGILFNRGIENIRNSIDQMYSQSWNNDKIKTTAKKYGLKNFKNQWQQLIYGH